MSKFKVGDLIKPTPKACKSFLFQSRVVFPWEVVEVEGEHIRLKRFSKTSVPRLEWWAEDWFEKVGEDKPT